MNKLLLLLPILVWDAPTTFIDGTPLLPGDLSGYELSRNGTAYPTISPNVLEYDVGPLTPGTHSFQVVAISREGDRSDPSPVLQIVATLGPAPTRTPVPTRTLVPTRTATPTFTVTQTRTVTPTRAPTLTPTKTKTPTPTFTVPAGVPAGWQLQGVIVGGVYGPVSTVTPTPAP